MTRTMSRSRLSWPFKGAIVCLAPAIIMLMAASTPAYAADQGQTLTIHALLCPPAYEGDAFAAECTTPAVGFEFLVGENPLAATEEGGSLTVDVGPGASGTSIEILNPVRYELLTTECDSGDQELVVTYSGDTGAAGPIAGVHFLNSGDVVCTFYFLAPDEQTADQTDTAASASSDDGSPVSSLPDTGVLGKDDDGPGWPTLVVVLIALGAGWQLRRTAAAVRP